MSTQAKSNKFTNVLERMGLSTIKSVSRNIVPPARGAANGSLSLYRLQLIQDFDAMLRNLRETSTPPYEIVAELNLNSPAIKLVADSRKSFTHTLRATLKRYLRKYDMQDRFYITTRDSGKQFFVVGR